MILGWERFQDLFPVGCDLVQPQVRLGKDIMSVLQQTHGCFNSGEGIKAVIYIKITCQTV